MIEVLSQISGQITEQRDQTSPLLVAVNGIDGSGKTQFAKKMARILEDQGENVIVVSIDDFHNPRSIRHQLGRGSPIGFYHDSYNYEAFRLGFLDPVKDTKSYVTRVFDLDKDCELGEEQRKVNGDEIFLVEGIFLFRPELVGYWDYKIFLDVSFETALSRNIQRESDQRRIGSEQKIIDLYYERYQPGQELYFQESHPKEMANLVIDNNDYNNPRIQ